MDRGHHILDAAREAYRRRDWPRARELFLEARAVGDLAPDDLTALGDAQWWLGLVDEVLSTCEEAYRRYLQGAQPRLAAMSALQLAVTLFLRGDEVLGSGWLARMRRLLRDEAESPEHGYARYLEVEANLAAPDPEAVIASAREVQAIGHRHGDPALVALGMVGEGRVLLKQGRVADGMALLDEAMLATVAGEMDPGWVGDIYCHLMAACYEVADLRRAGEWTRATERWCASFPSAVLFRGICRVHRAQLLQLQGAWEQAEHEADRVRDELAGIHLASVAEAHYAIGELRCLRGDLPGAEESFRQAHLLGRDPQPGMAVLRLAQGRTDAAVASITTALAAASGDRLVRFRLRAEQVDIAIAGGDLDTARDACAELAETAASYGTPGLAAAAAHRRGALLLAEARPGEALPLLRDAGRRWGDLAAPFEVARVRVLLARACRELGDDDAANLELDAAQAVFLRLGAAAGMREVAQLRGPVRLPDGLTAREAEVLALVATGKSNRKVAGELFISEKTVARHLSNIFAKTRVSSRTEAAAYAFAHDLVPGVRG